MTRQVSSLSIYIRSYTD